MNPGKRLASYRSAQKTADPAERDAEIQRHLPLVYTVVERIAAHLPPTVDKNDLFHAGVLGLIDAIDRFDASRDNAFSTYAVLRIRGAVIDELRARDWVPRGARQRARDYQNAVGELHRRLGHLPDDATLAAHLGVGEAELPELERAAALTAQISLDAPVGDNARIGDFLAKRDDTDASPARHLERADQRRMLLEVLAGLREQERLIIKLYYFEGLLMREIAKILGVTESRVCQIHTRLMGVLRNRLENAGFEA
jgi:RNA polymerase sigma factor for flagellar operon FliA